MVFKRLFNTIRANINAGSPSGKNDVFEAEYMNGDTDTSQVTPTDPSKVRELSYLSNLELKPDAGFEEIKAAYKRLIKQYHPDRFSNQPEKQKFAEQVTTQLNEAYAYFEKKYGKS